MFTRYSDRKATEAEVRFFLRQMVSAQVALHQAHVYPIDVKLTNMMVTPQGDLKVIDFGLATTEDDRMMGQVGADGYNTPEMMFNKPFHPSMIEPWNDGIIIYKMLYGVYCFGSNQRLT
jgi:cyclin-dependent kinase 12/13